MQASVCETVWTQSILWQVEKGGGESDSKPCVSAQNCLCGKRVSKKGVEPRFFLYNHRQQLRKTVFHFVGVN